MYLAAGVNAKKPQITNLSPKSLKILGNIDPAPLTGRCGSGDVGGCVIDYDIGGGGVGGNVGVGGGRI